MNSCEFDFFNSGNSEVVVFVSKMPRSSGYSYHAPGAGANMGNGGPDVDVKVKDNDFFPVEMIRSLLLLLLM